MLFSLIAYYSYVLNTNIVNAPRVLFFTGGNSLMPEELYSSFLSKIKKVYPVTVIKNNDNILEQLIEHSNENVLPISHSSGSTTLLNYCSKFKNMNQCVLLDPVDNKNLPSLPSLPFINNNNKESNNEQINFNKVLLIEANKSYKWKFENMLPKKLPFIPAFKMNKNMFNNITTINIRDYGHCDILDQLWSNLMHNSIAEGNDDRDSLDEYKELIIKFIELYYNNNLKDENCLPLTNIEYTIN